MLIQREQQRYSDIRMDMQHDLEKLRKEQKKLEDVSNFYLVKNQKIATNSIPLKLEKK
jgi:hypothetical protein